jgi:hypothetical protein
LFAIIPMCHFYGNKRDAAHLENAQSAVHQQRPSGTRDIISSVNVYM